MLHEPSITKMILGATRAAEMRPFAHWPSLQPAPAVPLTPLPAIVVGLSKLPFGRLSTACLSSPEQAVRTLTDARMHNASHEASRHRPRDSVMVASLRHTSAPHL